MQCTKCGHSLFGISSDRCPECGQPFDSREDPTRKEALRFYSLQRGIVGASLGLAVGLPTMVATSWISVGLVPSTQAAALAVAFLAVVAVAIICACMRRFDFVAACAASGLGNGAALGLVLGNLTAPAPTPLPTISYVAALVVGGILLPCSLSAAAVLKHARASRPPRLAGLRDPCGMCGYPLLPGQRTCPECGSGSSDSSA